MQKIKRTIEIERECKKNCTNWNKVGFFFKPLVITLRALALEDRSPMEIIVLNKTYQHSQVYLIPLFGRGDSSGIRSDGYLAIYGVDPERVRRGVDDRVADV